MTIYDPVRRAWFILQPEELVRQTMVYYLTNEKKYPLSRCRTEFGLKINELQKRCDIVVFDKSGQPAIIVECKRAEITINQDTFDQIARYNMVLRVPILVVTNGITTYCCRIDWEKESYEFLSHIP